MPKRSRADLSLTSKRRRTFVDDGDDVSPASSLLRSFGFRPITSGRSFELTKEIPHIQQKITKSFESDTGEGWTSLEVAFKDDAFLTACLTPLECAAGVNQPPGGARTFTVVRCLLDCPVIQEKLCSFLIEAVVAFNEGLRGGKSTAGRILAQFRWVLFPSGQDEAVVKKFLELLSTLSDGQLQHDLIALLPEVATSPAAVSLVSERLRDLLLSDPRQQLATVVFDALTDMPLADSDRQAVRETAVDLLDSSPVAALPIMVKYLLQSAPCTKAEERAALCTELRRRLDWDCFALTPVTTSTPAVALLSEGTECDSSAEHASAAVLTADVLRVHCTFQRGLADAWVRVISEAEGADAAARASSDLLLLLVLQPLSKRKTVEQVVRARARSGCFEAEMLPVLFRNHRALLKSQFPALLSLAQTLLPPHSGSDPASEFAAGLYFHAYFALPSYYQQEVIGALVTHVGSSRGPEANVAFETLSKMARKDPLRLLPFAVFIKSLFDGVEAFTCDQVRYLYDILSCLAFRCGQETALREELHILVRKQLAHTSPFYRSLGVIGAVSMLQYLVSSESGSNDSSLSQVSGLSSGSSAPPPPCGSSREVVRLLRLVRASYSQVPALGSLFMDEVFGLLARNVLDSAVEAWIGDNTVRDFQNDFVVDNALPEAAANRWLLRLALDKESACSIAINLGPLWLGAAGGAEAPERAVSALCLAPHFRLLCFTERRSEPSSQGNLGDIDGLLGAPLVLPNDYERRPALLALLANYLIEALNGFCRLTSDEMRAKLLWRLGHLVAARKQLVDALAEAGACESALAEGGGGGRALPWHSLPRVIYEAGSDWTLEGSVVRVVKKPHGGATSKGAKKKKKNRQALKALRAALDQEEETQDGEGADGTTAQVLPEERTPKDLVDLASLRLCQREIDLEVHRILTFKPICIVDMESLNSSVGAETQVELSLPSAAFLLTDFRSKVAFRLGEKPKALPGGFGRGPTEAAFHRHLVASHSEAQVAAFAVELTPALCRLMRRCVTFLRGGAAEDGDSVMPDATCGPGLAARTGFLAVLDILRLLCEWLTRAANRATHRKQLEAVLKAVADKDVEEESENEEEEENTLAGAAVKALSELLDALPDIHVAVTLTQLLRCLCALTGSEEAQGELHERSLELLNRDWDTNFESEGQKYRDALLSLIEVHFSSVTNTRRADFLKEMAEDHLKRVLEDGGRCVAYSTLTRQTFAVFYRAALTQSLQVVRFAYMGAAPSERKLNRWKRATDVMSALMQLLRQKSDTGNVASFLRVGKTFVQSMLSHAMPLLDEIFVARQEEVTAVLKQIQQITRFLQHLCVYCKGQADGGLARHVPQLKRLLEAFIYRVKVMLSSNHCAGAFWLGNLKNRDLQGQEIRSEEEDEGSEQEPTSEVGSLSGSDVDSDAGSVSESY